MNVCGDKGGQLSFAATDVQQPSLNWIVDVPALEARLADALHFQSGVQRLDAPPAQAALTVVCEGRRSATRAEFGFDYQVKAYPHHALAARLRLTQPHGGVARQWFHAGEIAALLPLGGEGGHDVALVWSVDAAKAQRLQKTEPAEFAAELAAVCRLPASELTLTHAPQAWPLELSQATHWVLPGVALAGDAAHAMHPLAGQGLNMGLGDATELARVLQAREYWRELGDPKLLRRYERARKAEFAAMGGLTDGLFVLFNHGNGMAQTLRNWGLNGVNRLPPLKHWLTRQAMGSAFRA
jgi:ubiquinone biosynthesis UbiH/UbiF/VisC/COQ6 family hydroxylase